MWAQLVNGVLGVWLMAAPAILGYGDPAQMNDRIVGPIAVSIAGVAVANVTRGMRWLNVPLGAWLIVAPWLLGYNLVPTINSTIVGLLLIAFALVHGRVRDRYGGGWSVLLPGRDIDQEIDRSQSTG